MQYLYPLNTTWSNFDLVLSTCKAERWSLFHFLIHQTLITLDWFIVLIAYFLSLLQRDCPAGQLSRQKFLEVYSEFFPGGNAEEFCEHVFRTFDTDNGGTIDFKEFLLAINITSSGKVGDKLNWAFSMYDIDGNGTIEKSEMVRIIGVSWHLRLTGIFLDCKKYLQLDCCNEIISKIDCFDWVLKFVSRNCLFLVQLWHS